MDDSKGTQLNKYIALSGVCSRRRAEELIREGKISVNYEVVTDCGYRVQPEDIVTHVDEHIRPEKKVYILLNKPKDTITTTKDDRGRKTVLDLIEHQVKARLFPIGRLDRGTTGVLVLTNDGELTQKMAHPKFNISKTYIATLDRALNHDDYLKLLSGVKLIDGFIKPDGIYYIGGKKNIIKVILHSGKNRIVRRMFEHLRYRVSKLDRINFGSLTKQALKPGQWKLLSHKDVEALLQPAPRREVKPVQRETGAEKPMRSTERPIRKPALRKPSRPAPRPVAKAPTYHDDAWDFEDDSVAPRKPARTVSQYRKPIPARKAPKTPAKISYREDTFYTKANPISRKSKSFTKITEHHIDDFDIDEESMPLRKPGSKYIPKTKGPAQGKPAASRRPAKPGSTYRSKEESWDPKKKPRYSDDKPASSGRRPRATMQKKSSVRKRK